MSQSIPHLNSNRLKRSAALAARKNGLAVALVIQTVTVALLGGSSRYDNAQLVGLQPIGWLIVGYLALHLRRENVMEFKAPAIFLMAIVLLLFLQLLPLPVAVWSALSGREPIFELDQAIGWEVMRPISFVPSRTLNAFANLCVPIAGMAVFMALRERRLHLITIALIALAFVNASFALIQTLGPGGELLYFYHSQNNGAAVGLFANPNHAAVYGSVMMVFIACVISSRPFGRQQSGRTSVLTISLYGLYGFVFLMSLISGSRAGLLTNAIALIATAAILISSSGRNTSKGWGKPKKLPIAGLVIAVVGIFITVIFVLSDQLPAFDSLVIDDPLQDMRFKVTPALFEMIKAYSPFGSGVGSFEDVYYIHEARGLLQPAYLNMAHNDWLQFVIETGVLGLGVLAAAMVWVVYRAMRMYSDKKMPYMFACIGIFVIVAGASLVDYPLRTPLFQLTAVWFALMAVEVVQPEAK